MNAPDTNTPRDGLTKWLTDADVDALAGIARAIETKAIASDREARPAPASVEAAARELVELKDMKGHLDAGLAADDEEHKALADDYARRKPLAWAAMRSALAASTPPAEAEPDSNLPASVWLNDTGTGQKLTFAPLAGAFEHHEYRRATPPRAALSDRATGDAADRPASRDAMRRGALVEAVAKAIVFEDCGSTEDWQENTNLAEAAIRVCDARNPPRCSYCHASTSAALSAAPAESIDARWYVTTPKCPDEFRSYVEKNYIGEVVFHDPAWHAERLWRAACRASAPAAPPVAPADDDDIKPLAGGGRTTTQLQQEALDAGFTYWRAPDAHGIEGTIEHAIEFIRSVVGVEVDITDRAATGAAGEPQPREAVLHPLDAELRAYEAEGAIPPPDFLARCHAAVAAARRADSGAAGGQGDGHE